VKALRIAAALRISAALALTAAAAAALAQDEPTLSIGGSAEARPFARFSFGGSSVGAAYGSASTIGLDLDARGSRARAYASAEAALLSGEAAASAWTAEAAARAAGLDTGGLLVAPSFDPIEDAPPTLLEARIRALYVKLDLGWASIAAGRQVIKYQRCPLWSPTDVYTELDLSGISPVRRGADALRATFPLGATGAFDLATAPGADLSEGRYSARLSGFLAGVDAAAIAFRDGGRAGAAGAWSAGASLHADIELGLDAELLAAWDDDGGAQARAAAGADYSIGDFILAAEYYYNGGGAGADRTAPGSHNAYASIAWRASDFVAISASAILGISEEAWSATLSASVDAAQNADLASYARLSTTGPAAPLALEAGASIAIKF
jgi:hypothetical protein